MKYFAVIPARGGSKGIKNKNMQLIGSKPMIQYTFETALNSKYLNLSILSSDDQKIISLAKELEINVPFIRPTHLAEDTSNTIDVMKHSLDWYKSDFGNFPENIVLLQPTSPFRNCFDLDQAIELFEKSQKGSLISACEVSQHPSECFIISEMGELNFIELKNSSHISGRQCYNRAYFLDGAIYISKTDRFFKTNSFFDNNSAVFILPKNHAIDVDDIFDLTVARALEKYYVEENNDRLKH